MTIAADTSMTGAATAAAAAKASSLSTTSVIATEKAPEQLQQ